MGHYGPGHRSRLPLRPMHAPHVDRAPWWMMALAVLFSGLLVSLAVMPTLLIDENETSSVSSPTPTEEEQLHGRDVHKLGTVPDRSWCCMTFLMDQRLRAAFRDRDEALPNGPISDVPHQPPKAAC